MPTMKLTLATDVAEAPVAEAPAAPVEDFHAVMAIEEAWTGDNRYFEAGAFSWRELPLPLMADDQNRPAHMESQKIGDFTRIERIGAEIHGWGTYDVPTDPASATGQRVLHLQGMIRNNELRGISVDWDSPDLTVEIPIEDDPYAALNKDSTEEDADAADGEKDQVITIEVNADTMPREIHHGARLTGATALPFPAFQEAYIEPLLAAAIIEMSHRVTGWMVCDCDAALTAAAAIAAPAVPPRPWFDNPRLQGPTPLTVTDDGQVYGHIADRSVCHIGYADRCVTAPYSATNYAHFMLGDLLCEDGSRVAVGRLTAGTGHADRNASLSEAAAHYDNTGYAVADVCAGDDEFGIWVAGAIRPEATPSQIRALMASPPSGDWRASGGNLEMIAVLAVNVPGFPVRRDRSLAASAVRRLDMKFSEGGALRTLIASLPPVVSRRAAVEPRPAHSRATIDLLARTLGHDKQTRLARLRERIAR